MKKLSIKQLFSYSLAILIQKFSAFLILPIIASYLSVKDFGLANQIISIGGFYILIVMFGLDESIAKKGFDSNSKGKSYILNGFVLLSINIGLFSFLALEFSDIFYVKFLGDISQTYIILSVALISCTPFYLVYLKVLRLSNNSKEFFFVVLGQVVVQSSLLLSLVSWFDMGVKGFLLSHLFSSFLCVLYVFVRIRNIFFTEKVTFDALKNLYTYGSKIAPHTIATWGLWGFSVVYAGKVLGSEAAAQLVAINYIPLIASVASYAFFYTYQPWLYENLKVMKSDGLLARKIAYFGIFFLFFLSLIFIGSEYIFNLLFDKRYFLDNTILTILLLACLFQFMGSMYTYVLYYYEDVTKYVAMSTLIGGGVNVLLFNFLTSTYELFGVALSFMFAQLIIALIRFFLANKALVRGNYVRRGS